MWAWRMVWFAGLVCLAQPGDWATRPLFSLDSAKGPFPEIRAIVETPCEGAGERRRIQSVTFGHFLDPKSEEAVVSTVGCEPHSLLFGGSFVLTKRDGKWRSLGYRAAMITEECHTLSTGSGRDFLLCSHVMGMQGSVSRVLRAYDFQIAGKPRTLFSIAIWNEMRAHDAEAFRVAEQGVIESVGFEDLDGDGVADVTIVARKGRVERTDAELQRFMKSGGTWVPELRVPRYRVEYLVEWDGVAMTPRSHSAARVFAIE